MKEKIFPFIFCVVCTLFPLVVFAQDAPEFQRVDDGLSVNHLYQIWTSSRDRETFGEKIESRQEAFHQLNVNLKMQMDSIKLKLNMDLMGGQIYGPAPSEVPDAFQTHNANLERRGKVFEDLVPNIVDPNEFYIEYKDTFLIRLGLQQSHYGLGLIANSGQQKSRDLFGQPVGGDRVLRLVAGFQPFASDTTANPVKQKINFAIGGDYVFIDDNANVFRGDQALQGIASVFYKDQNIKNPEENTFLGLYFAHRNQTDNSGDKLIASAIDLSGRKTWTSESNSWFYDFGFESALLTGTTDRAYTLSGKDKTRILGFGTAVELSAHNIPLQIGAKLKSGYASGDANGDDDTLFRFRFDPNYKAGLILFEHYLPAMTRRSYERATDPTKSGQIPRGAHGIISDGAIENSFFLNPQVLLGKSDGLLGGVGVLWAQSAVPLSDPYSTFKAGGTGVGINGAKASRDLGLEVNAAIQYKFKILEALRLEAKIEYGILFPGSAFDDAQGNGASPQNLVRGRLGLAW